MANKKFTLGGVITTPGNIAEYKTGDWRAFKPNLDQNKCIKCGICWAHCPDGAVEHKDGKFIINYDYCKGCGICSNVCPVKAIKMELEEK